MNTRTSAIKSPYVGPIPFEQQDKDLFFGRPREIHQLMYLLTSERIVMLHSPSGAGKTSLIQAGLIPLLAKKKKRFQVLPLMHVGNIPDPAILKTLPNHNRYLLSAIMSLEEELAEDKQMQIDKLAATEFEIYLEEQWQSEENKPNQILIFDQFEELITSDPIDQNEKAEFFRQIGAALRHPRLWALFSIREDYLGDLDPYLLSIPGRLDTRFRLDLLDKNAALEAIQEPSNSMGVKFKDDAAERLRMELSKVRVQSLDGSSKWVDGPYAEPILLQVVCQYIWGLRDSQEMEINLDLVESIGNVDNALSNFYSFQVETIATKTGINVWLLRDWFERRLITQHGIRSQVLKEANQSGGLDNQVIEDLVRIHIVRPESRRGLTWFELAHDRLIEPIRMNNSSWRERNLSPFYSRAVRWSTGDILSDNFLTEGELEEMKRWVKMHPERVTDEEADFLEASRNKLLSTLSQRQAAAERRTNLADLGWGVIFSSEDQGLVHNLKESLGELLALRQEQAGDRYREFTSLDAYRPGETAESFLVRHGIGPSVIDPDKVPYYLMIVGDPNTIPFEFQYDIGVLYSVGRIHFERLEDYARYARSIVMAEQGRVRLPPKAAFFSPQYSDDRGSMMLNEELVKPLFENLVEMNPLWEIDNVLETKASKTELTNLLGGDQTPALLFTSSYAVPFPLGDKRQLALQGALVCQDWPGPKKWKGEYQHNFIFGAEDVADEAQLLGLIAFLWGNYTVGTPKLENFHHIKFREPAEIAPHSFLSRLPQRLLSHPQGGALAVIGHVDEVWRYSFTMTGVGTQFNHFEQTLQRLVDGHTVGSALEPFKQRYTSLAFPLWEQLQPLINTEVSSDYEFRLADRLTHTIDARNYVILGDPAVRLPVDPDADSFQRPTIEPVIEVKELIGIEPQFINIFESQQQENELLFFDGLDASSGENLMFNGIHANSGEYLLPSLDLDQFTNFVLGIPFDEDVVHNLKNSYNLSNVKTLDRDGKRDIIVRRSLDKPEVEHF